MKIVSGIAIAAIIVGCCATAQAEVDNGNFQIEAAHDGAARFTRDFHAPLKRKWLVDLGSTVSYPVSGGGMIFVTVVGTGHGPQLFALSPRNGATIWNKNLTGTGGTPVYANGRVYVVSFSGDVQAFNAKTGKGAWDVQLDGEWVFDTPPTASNGLLYMTGAGSGGLIYALKQKSGALRWYGQLQGGETSPAVGAGGVYVGVPCDDYGFGAANGDVLWTYSVGCSGGGGAIGAYYNGRVYMDDTFEHFVFDAETGDIVHDFVEEAYPAAFWTPVSGSPLGYYVDGNGTLNAFNPVSIHINWSVPGTFSIAPVVVNDTVFIGDAGGTLHAYDAATGSQIYSVNVGAPIGGCCTIQRGLGVAANSMLLVPAATQLSAWVTKPD